MSRDFYFSMTEGLYGRYGIGRGRGDVDIDNPDAPLNYFDVDNDGKYSLQVIDLNR